MDTGVDGIITDYPGRLRDVMAERSLKVLGNTKSQDTRSRCSHIPLVGSGHG